MSSRADGPKHAIDERQRRLAANEALYRKVNEQAESLNDAFGGAGTIVILCECGDGECVQEIELAAGDYEQLRSDARAFAVLPTHVFEEIEDIVARGERYWVIRKREGGPAEIARATDPRRER